MYDSLLVVHLEHWYSRFSVSHFSNSLGRQMFLFAKTWSKSFMLGQRHQYNKGHLTNQQILHYSLQQLVWFVDIYTQK